MTAAATDGVLTLSQAACSARIHLFIQLIINGCLPCDRTVLGFRVQSEKNEVSVVIEPIFFPVRGERKQKN